MAATRKPRSTAKSAPRRTKAAPPVVEPEAAAPAVEPAPAVDHLARAEALLEEERALAAKFDDGDLADEDHEGEANVVSAAPPRPHASLVNQLRVRHEELVDFIRNLEGDEEGELGELLDLIRSHIAKRAAGV